MIYSINNKNIIINVSFMHECENLKRRQAYLQTINFVTVLNVLSVCITVDKNVYIEDIINTVPIVLSNVFDSSRKSEYSVNFKEWYCDRLSITREERYQP